MNLRGEVVPVLDSAALLGTGRLARADFAVVADMDAGLAALAADGEPATVDARGARRPVGARGRHRPLRGRGGVVALLDLDALLAPERIGAA